MAERKSIPITEGRGLNRKMQEVGWIFSRRAVQASWMLFLFLGHCGGSRTGPDREHSPNRGSHRCPHGAGSV